MSHDPRYVDDGLAKLVDELELKVTHEAWRPRWITGLPAPHPVDVDAMRRHAAAVLTSVDPIAVAELERIALSPAASAWRRKWLNSIAPPTKELLP